MKLTGHARFLWGITLLVVMVLSLFIPFAHTAVYWIALAFTGAMFALCAFTFVRTFHKDPTQESKLLGWPIFRVGYTGLLVQFLLGLMLMALSRLCPVWIALPAEIVLFGCVGISLTARDAARETVMQFEADIADKTAAWKAIRARAHTLAAETSHPKLRKLAEEIRYADPAPSSLDSDIAAQLETLFSHADEETIQKVFDLLQLRKHLIKEEN